MIVVPVLFARADSAYKDLPGVDVWDEQRDALNWPGGAPAVFHPPCRAWGRLRQFSKHSEAERVLAPWAVDQVRAFGGVLEHPAESRLFAHRLMPFPGRAPDAFGGWTARVDQVDFGHRAAKPSWFYFVGIHPDELPPMPAAGTPTAWVRPPKNSPAGRAPIITHKQREATPPALAAWLVEVARRCRR